MKRVILLCVVLIQQAVLPAIVHALADAAGPMVNARLGDSAYEHHLEGSVSDGQGASIVVRKRSVGVATGPWRSWVWSVGPSGNLVRETALKEPNQLPDADSSEVSAVAKLSDGSLVCLMMTKAGELRLARVSGESVAWSPGGNMAGTDLHIVQMIASSDGNLILMGRRGGRPAYLKVTLNGVKVWERHPETDSPGVVFDGVAAVDGGAFLVADYWNGDPYIIGDSSVWIARIDAGGSVVSQRKIAGRRPRIASSSGEDGVVVVYDQSNTVAQKIALQEFSGSLEPGWSTAVLANPKGLETFKVAALRHGGFGVAGGDDLKMFAAQIGPDGKTAWEFRSATIQSSDFSVVAGAGELYLIYPVISIIEANFHKQLNTKIQISVFKTER